LLTRLLLKTFQNSRHIHCSCSSQEETHPAGQGLINRGLADQGKFRLGVTTMAEDKRDTLELLYEELDFLEKGGYGRSVKTPWKPTSIFQDSLSCLNYGYPYQAHPCSECRLIDFVPIDGHTQIIPCHHIPLNEAGDTIETLETEENQQKLEESVKTWLRLRINHIEQERTRQMAV
jgi:hypothetical protein